MARQCTFSARLDCRYLLDQPHAAGAHTFLAVALHGFGQDAETMLGLMRGLLGPSHAIASVEAPYHFFLDAAVQKVGFCWITRRHAESSIRLHHDMVRHVIEEAGRDCGIPPARRFLAGFSQPVALNYRLVATFPDSVRGVLAFCGGLPGNWEQGPYGPVTASVLHIARTRDEVYPPAVTSGYEQRLRLRAADVEFHMLDGPHRFPSRSGDIVGRWLDRLARLPLSAAGKS